MKSFNATTNQEDFMLDLRDIVKNILRKKLFIIFIAIITLFVALAYVFFKPKHYQASVLLEVHHNFENSLGSLSDPSQKSTGENWNPEPATLQIALIRSKFILASVIDELNMAASVTPIKKSFFQWKHTENKAIEISELTLPKIYENKKLRLIIRNNQLFKLFDNKSNIILQGEIGERISNDHAFAIKIEALKSAIDGEYAVVKQSESQVINRLKSQLAIVDLTASDNMNPNKNSIIQLSVTADSYEQAMLVANTIAQVTKQKDTERKTAQAKKSLQFLYQQLPLVQDALKNAEKKLNDYRSTHGVMDISSRRNYLFSRLTSIDHEIADVHSKWQDMAQINTDEHPFVIAIKQKYYSLKQMRSNLLQEINKLPAGDQIEVSLKRDVNVKNNIYMTLLRKIQEQQVITAGVVSDIQILSAADTSDIYLPVKITLVIIASLIIGLLLGCLMVIVRQLSLKLPSTNVEFNTLS